MNLTATKPSSATLITRPINNWKTAVATRFTAHPSHVNFAALEADDAPLREATSCNADGIAHAGGNSRSRCCRAVRGCDPAYERGDYATAAFGLHDRVPCGAVE